MLDYAIAPADACAARTVMDTLSHSGIPEGGLGALGEGLARVAGLTGSADISLWPCCALILCADSGVARRGVTQSPQERTARMADAIAAGSSCVNILAARAGCDVVCVDLGMVAHPTHPDVLSMRIASGTRDITMGAAMTREETLAAIDAGVALVARMKARGYKLLATGELGMGNTTTTAALTCALLHKTPEETVGRGAGMTDAGMEVKREAVRRALSANKDALTEPLALLSALGGLEIAGLVGVLIGGAVHRVPVIVDGLVCAAAAIIACALAPECRIAMLPGNMSGEPSGMPLLAKLGLPPVVSAGLRIGEGTGAVMCVPLYDMALLYYNAACNRTVSPV